VKHKMENDVRWSFAALAFSFNGPQDNNVRWSVGECHLLFTYSIEDAHSGTPADAGVRKLTLVDAMSGADICGLSGWQGGWSYTATDLIPYGTIAASQYSIVEFVVKRTTSDGARSHSLMVAPAISYTPSDDSGQINWDCCLSSDQATTLTLTSSWD